MYDEIKKVNGFTQGYTGLMGCDVMDGDCRSPVISLTVRNTFNRSGSRALIP